MINVILWLINRKNNFLALEQLTSVTVSCLYEQEQLQVTHTRGTLEIGLWWQTLSLWGSCAEWDKKQIWT